MLFLLVIEFVRFPRGRWFDFPGKLVSTVANMAVHAGFFPGLAINTRLKGPDLAVIGSSPLLEGNAADHFSSVTGTRKKKPAPENIDVKYLQNLFQNPTLVRKNHNRGYQAVLISIPIHLMGCSQVAPANATCTSKKSSYAAGLLYWKEKKVMV